MAPTVEVRARKFAQFPEEAQLRADIPELDAYAKLNPEFVMPRSERAGRMLLGVYQEKGKPIPENEADRRREAFRHRLMAIIKQLDGNAEWAKRLDTAKEKYPEPTLERAQALTNGQIDRLMAVTAAANETEFTASPRTFLKTVQEILTGPTERVAYQRDEMDKSAVNVSTIIIDPMMITPTLLENLGLSQYKAPKGSSYADKVAANASAIPAIKDMLGQLEPFKLSYEGSRSRLHYFRLMRIGGGEHEGELLGTQTIGGRKILFRTDLHGAYRRIDHIDDQYSEEIGRLQAIVDKIAGIDNAIATRWKEIKSTDELDKIKVELCAMVEELQFVRNDHKKKILDLIGRCTTFTVQQKVPAKFGPGEDGKRVMKEPETTKDVVNPGAMRAQWNTVKNHVGLRISEIAHIRSYLAHDQTYIQNYMKAQSLPFDRFYDKVEKMHGDFKILKEDQPLSHEDAAKIRRNLLLLKQELGAYEKPSEAGNGIGKGVQFEPYLTFARRMMQHIDAACELLRREDVENTDRKAAASEFMKVYVVTKIQRVYKEIQQFFDGNFSREDESSSARFALMVNEINKFYLVIANKRVDERFEGKKIETKEYDDLFGEIYHLCHSLRKKANQGKALDKDDSAETRKKIFEAMKEQIKGFKFDELMEKYFGPIEAPATQK